jgi:Cu-Zn family superoxide dismutase
MRTREWIPLVALMSLATVVGAAAQQQTDGENGAITARALLKNTSDATVGDAMLQETPKGVLLKVGLRGVQPGIHAFHIHQTGRCEPPTFESSGGHFAPEGHEHGILDPKGPHAGDLPNVHVPASGDLAFEYFVDDVSLRSGRRDSLLDADGSALLMHQGADDYRTEPAGDAGTRIVCGVIMR